MKWTCEIKRKLIIFHHCSHASCYLNRVIWSVSTYIMTLQSFHWTPYHHMVTLVHYSLRGMEKMLGYSDAEDNTVICTYRWQSKEICRGSTAEMVSVQVHTGKINLQFCAKFKRYHNYHSSHVSSHVIVKWNINFMLNNIHI